MLLDPGVGEDFLEREAVFGVGAQRADEEVGRQRGEPCWVRWVGWVVSGLSGVCSECLVLHVPCKTRTNTYTHTTRKITRTRDAHAGVVGQQLAAAVLEEEREGGVARVGVQGAVREENVGHDTQAVLGKGGRGRFG